MLVLMECFSSLIACVFSGFHVQRNFPLKPSVLHKNHKTVCVCRERERERESERERGVGAEGGSLSVLKSVSGHLQVHNVFIFMLWKSKCPHKDGKIRHPPTPPPL